MTPQVFKISRLIRSRICCVCGHEITGTRHGPYDAGNGRTGYACGHCYNQPCLWFPDRPACVRFTERVRAARAAEQAWGLAPDLHDSQGRIP